MDEVLLEKYLKKLYDLCSLLSQISNAIFNGHICDGQTLPDSIYLRLVVFAENWENLQESWNHWVNIKENGNH